MSLKINLTFFVFFSYFSPSGGQHFVHPERDEFSNHHYSISSQNPVLVKQETTSSDTPTERNSTSVSASKVKWFEAVRTVKQLNQVSH